MRIRIYLNYICKISNVYIKIPTEPLYRRWCLSLFISSMIRSMAEFNLWAAEEISLLTYNRQMRSPGQSIDNENVVCLQQDRRTAKRQIIRDGIWDCGREAKILTYWGLDKMAEILQTSIQMHILTWVFQTSLPLVSKSLETVGNDRVVLRLGAGQVTGYYLHKWWFRCLTPNCTTYFYIVAPW